MAKSPGLISFILNNEEVKAAVPRGMPLLDYIRYHKNLKGTKIGCREGDCGACTVLVGSLQEGKLIYRSVTSCLMPVVAATGKHIVTIEGINSNGLNPVQEAMHEEGATQCGFCTPGFVVSLAGYCLNETPAETAKGIACIDGNICRCTGYKSIERAAVRINELLKSKSEDAITFVTDNKILPDYFKTISSRLERIKSSEDKIPVKMSGNTQLVAGGTDLYVQKHDAMVHSEVGLLSDESSMKGISMDDQRCVIGASATVTELCESPVIQKMFPQFAAYAKLVSSTPIRNMATLAGNFVNASPIGDFTVFFLALDATVVLTDGDHVREV